MTATPIPARTESDDTTVKEGSSRRPQVEPRATSTDFRLDLEAPEVEILHNALRKYRACLPIYLQSVQPELSALDALLDKLGRLTR